MSWLNLIPNTSSLSSMIFWWSTLKSCRLLNSLSTWEVLPCQVSSLSAWTIILLLERVLISKTEWYLPTWKCYPKLTIPQWKNGLSNSWMRPSPKTIFQWWPKNISARLPTNSVTNLCCLFSFHSSNNVLAHKKFPINMQDSLLLPFWSKIATNHTKKN